MTAGTATTPPLPAPPTPDSPQWHPYVGPYVSESAVQAAGLDDASSDDVSVGTASTAALSSVSGGPNPKRRSSLRSDYRYSENVEGTAGRGVDERKKKKKGGGRGRGALKSIGRSVRSRSPFRASESSDKAKAPPSKEGRHRSRSRSPLRRAADALVKTVSGKALRRPKSVDDLVKSEDAAAGAGGGGDDAAVDVPGLTRSNSRSSLSTDASDDASSSSAATAESIAVRTFFIGNDASPLLPCLSRENETYDEEEEETPAYEVSLVEQSISDPLPQPLPAIEVVEVREVMKSPKKICKSKSSRRKGDAQDKIGHQVKEKKSSPSRKVTRMPMMPSGLTSRTSAKSVISKLRAGPSASAAVRQLRERQSGLVDPSSPSHHPKGSKFSYTSVAGVLIPDYAKYVDSSVATFRRKIGVSDKEYEGIKKGLFGWVRKGPKS